MRKIFVSLLLIFVFCLSVASCTKNNEGSLKTGAGRITKPIDEIEPQAMGEPVPGAEIYVELEPDDEPIINVIADGEGNFEFGGLGGNSGINPIPSTPLPPKGTFIFTIKPNESMAKKYSLKTNEKIRIRVSYETNEKNPVFRYTLNWKKLNNKGAFEVKKRSNSTK